ncbi:hypothetical protein COS59_00520 [Candidatus Wolfebacteria bacterium CG03_land_8_20_14_0_80_36_15]|uniref:Homing endonuclease LAGLIDADG domain-containing protein n=1 Tax=Candidatus Wolfebacteria bacterium CG03_land_8_20_14_0_80_36_15 TaxID=1975067 RepID=A0A2M7B861_9BACT|nr:MAG: hypothetical protein COS59_00520 [Candidatus Wolfebacteria bacterium CG03_land_8_20_14_0_80_36_15]
MRHVSMIYLGCMGRTKPIVSADYVVGLTDGEGCFYVNVADSSSYRGGARIDLNFYVKMNEKDIDLLLKIKNTLGCGNVYFQKEQRKNHTQCYRYTVGSHRDVIGKIIPFFKKHRLQSASKQKSFHAFCKIAEIVQTKRHLTKNGVKQIRKLKAQMNKKTIGLA